MAYSLVSALYREQRVISARQRKGPSVNCFFKFHPLRTECCYKRRTDRLPKEAYEPGGRAAALLNGEEAGTVDRRDLALEAAFTSMSLCERCREPGVEGALALTSLPSTAEQHVIWTHQAAL